MARGEALELLITQLDTLTTKETHMDTIQAGQTVYIRPKWGFWNTTHYPRGGKFQRNGWSYLPVVVLRAQIDRLPHEIEVKLPDGDIAIIKREALRAQLDETH